MARQSKPVLQAAGIEIAASMKGDRDAKKAMFTKYRSAPWNLSKDKIYSVAAEYGYESGRKTRCDKGKIRLPGIDEEQLEFAVKVILAATRPKSGKKLIPTATLLEQLMLNGYAALANVSVSTLNRWLRERNLNHEQLQAGNPAVQMRARYPNHIHFFDASICVQWDLKGGKKMVPRDMQKAYYKNKPGLWKSVRKVLIRWLVVDHCSGAFWVEYTYAGGENTADLLKVLLNAWGEKPEISNLYPFHGVPDRVGLDPGAANTSHEVMELFKKLDIKTYVHSPGNARASGCVETVHAFWERRFEWELLLNLANDLEELNARAHDRMINLNAMNVHSRHGKTRSAKWMEIRGEQLRLLPPKEHCMLLATSEPVSRVPDECLRISFNNSDYQLTAPALKRQKVWVDHHPWQEGELNVRTHTGEAVQCRRIVKDSHGYDDQAAFYGEDKFSRHADTAAQRLCNEFESEDKATRLNGFTPQPTAHLVPDQHFMPRRGREIPLETLPPAAPVKVNEVAGKLRQRLGIEQIDAVMRTALDSKLQGLDLISTEQFEELVIWAQDAWVVNLPNARSNPFTRNLQEDVCQQDQPCTLKTSLVVSEVRAS